MIRALDKPLLPKHIEDRLLVRVISEFFNVIFEGISGVGVQTYRRLTGHNLPTAGHVIYLGYKFNSVQNDMSLWRKESDCHAKPSSG